MKKFVIGASLSIVLMLCSTSCGGGSSVAVDNDTVVSQQLADEFSSTLGAFMGCNRQDEVRYSQNISDYIEGYQLVVGNRFSDEKLLGIRAGLYIADQFQALENEGIEMNRDLFLQEFRKYIQKMDLDAQEYALLYQKFQDVLKSVDEIMEKREQMRNSAPEEEVMPVNVEVVEETEEVEVSRPSANSSDANLEFAEIETAYL